MGNVSDVLPWIFFPVWNTYACLTMVTRDQVDSGVFKPPWVLGTSELLSDLVCWLEFGFNAFLPEESVQLLGDTSKADCHSFWALLICGLVQRCLLLLQSSAKGSVYSLGW